MQSARSITQLALLLSSLIQASLSIAGNASDQLDELDHEEFGSNLSRASKCSEAGDFACTAKYLSLANSYATDSKDREVLNRAWAQLELDKHKVLREQAKAKYADQQSNLAEKTRATQQSNEALTQYTREQRAENAGRIAQLREEAPRVLSMTESVQAGLNQVQRDKARINGLHDDAVQRLRQQQQMNAQARQQSSSRPARSPQPRERSEPKLQTTQSSATAASTPVQISDTRPIAVTASTVTAPTKTPAPATPIAPALEALAFCWKNSKEHWFCDGRVDETTLGEKDLDKQLSAVGCKTPRRLSNVQLTLTSLRVAKRTPQTGWIYGCGDTLKEGDTGAATWNRDIRRFWQGIPF